MTRAAPSLAVWKFASCDGCQLSLLNCEDELLTLAGALEIALFHRDDAAPRSPGPYDLSLVEGSISTPEHLERIQAVRAASRRLVTIGACATAGGIQGLRNFASAGEYVSTVYAHPDYIATLETSTPMADHVEVDLELHGLPDRSPPASRGDHRLPRRASPSPPGHSVCQECKGRGNGLRARRSRHGLPRACHESRAAGRSARPSTAAASAASVRPTPPTLLARRAGSRRTASSRWTSRACSGPSTPMPRRSGREPRP